MLILELKYQIHLVALSLSLALYSTVQCSLLIEHVTCIPNLAEIYLKTFKTW
jgi:hypothetical protein